MRRIERWLAVLAVSACQGPPGTGDQPDNGGQPARNGDLALVRSARWPGAGIELTIRLDRPTDQLLRDRTDDVYVVGRDDAVTRRVALAVGYTVIMVQPDRDSGVRAEQQLALRELIAARPSGERIALYRWGESVEQVLGFESDRMALLQSVDRAVAAPLAQETPLAPALAIERAATVAQQVGDQHLRVMRSLVVIGPAVGRPETATTATFSVAGQPEELVGRALQASRAIDTVAAAGHYTVALCSGTDPDPLVIEVAGVDGSLALPMPEPWPEAIEQPCDAGHIGAEPQPVPQLISLEFTDQQRAIYDSRVTNLSKADFDLSVRLFPDQQAIPATAHLRGKGTLGCERKSYTITLDGPGRHLFEDRYDDEFYLIAMCGDERYIQLHTGFQLLAELGLLPSLFRYVEVHLDGEQGGVYLLSEKLDDVMLRMDGRIDAVVRRRFSPPADSIDVEKSELDGGEVRDRWQSMVEDLAPLSGLELVAAAAQRIDLDQFLDWIALMTALQNGDYVDEVFAAARQQRAANGEIEWYWTFAGWDTDDLFSGCHYNGNHALEDARQLVYCAEGTLEKLLLTDSDGYRAYIDRLEMVLERISPEQLQHAIDRTGERLLPYFARADICQAMVELLEDNPATIDPDAAQRDIRAHLRALRDDYTLRRAVLLDRIADYRSENP